jgi:hypothetical protein
MKLRDLFPKIGRQRAPNKHEGGGVAQAQRIKASCSTLDHSPTSEIVTFGITLASARSVASWQLTCALLSQTLQSVLRQTDPRLRVVICGHEMPAILELNDDRVEFLSLQHAPPERPDQFRADKFRKRFNLGRRLHERGGGYYMQLDADDLVHRGLVAEVLGRRHPNGHLVTCGFVRDWSNGLVASVPGVWSLGLDRVCGSTSILFYEQDDLPSSPVNDPTILFNMCTQHNVIQISFEEQGRPLEMLETGAVIYTVNHTQNISFLLQKSGRRKTHIVDQIKRLAISSRHELAALDRDFGTDFLGRSEQ